MIPREKTIDEFPVMQMVRTGRFIRMFGRITMICLVLAILAMVFVPWRQTARGVGMVVALNPQERPQPVRSPSKGVVSYVKEDLREGSYVEAGEIVIELTPFAADGVAQVDTQILALKAKKDSTVAALGVAKARRDMTKLAGESLNRSLDEDLRVAREKLDQANDEVVSIQADLDDKLNKLRTNQAVEDIGLVPQLDLFSMEKAVESAEAKLKKAKNYVDELEASVSSKIQEIEGKKQKNEIENTKAELYVQDVEQKIATVDKELLDLENKRSELDRLKIPAPRSGRIQQWYGLTGSDIVKEGDQLFVIVPETDELSVELTITGNDMPLVQEDDRVRLQFEGWPAVQFVGWPSVAVGTFGGKVNRVFPTDDGKGNFRVVVTPDNHFEREDGWPDDRYLRQGVRANGWVLLQEVPLGYEIWRQLNGFPPTLTDGAPKEKKAEKPKLPKP
ncbi:MAG: HlyD family efflux transporter periplasmic adaptor subunit [Planctomycetota bacterium]